MKIIEFGNTNAKFQLMFFSDEQSLTKYKKIKCDFKIGEYWSGSATLIPKQCDPAHLIKASQLVLTKEGSLVLECQMKLTCYFIDDYVNYVDSGKKLMKDLREMLLSGDHSDLTLVVKNREMKVHKSVLAARSPVFKLMLSTEMKEKLESRITLPDVSVEAANSFVKFLYTAEVTATECSRDLLSLAALYQIDDLKRPCERMLITQLNGENAMENLFIANLHNCTELKMKSFQLIA